MVAGTLVAALIAAAAFVGGLYVATMGTPGTDSPEAGFARDMSSHHAQAIEMSWETYGKATRPEVKIMAVDIATSQQYEIGMMETWLREWGVPLNSGQPQMAWMPGNTGELTADGLMPGMATAEEKARLRAAQGPEVDILFCQLMLRHHLGGIHMIDGILAVSHDETVRDAAQRMRNTQSKEIGLMEQLLAELGAPTR